MDDLTPERLDVAFLLAAAKFGLTMAKTAKVLRDEVQIKQALQSAASALKTANRFRAGIWMKAEEAQLLSELLTQLAREVLEIQRYLE